ncbi:MAG: hypothetical protein ABL904_08465 [Hyphomicrobiaceae bacterium]
MQHAQATAIRQPTSDRRMVLRREVRLTGRIKIADQPWLACTIRNISPMGALLEFTMPVVLPRHFRLQIPIDLFEVECDLRHYDATNAGVLFTNNRGGAMAHYA